MILKKVGIKIAAEEEKRRLKNRYSKLILGNILACFSAIFGLPSFCFPLRLTVKLICVKLE
jgi:hypothetical protein